MSATDPKWQRNNKIKDNEQKKKKIWRTDLTWARATFQLFYYSSHIIQFNR